MKKLLIYIAFVIVALTTFLASFPSIRAAAATIAFPAFGGTGTNVPPTLNQILVGQSNGVYAPQATATLTSATTTNFFSSKASTTQLFLATGTGCLSANASGLVSANGVACGSGGGGAGNSKWATSTGSDITPNGGGGIILSASSTLANFVGLNSTSTNATTTNDFSATASSTNLFATNFNLGSGIFGNATGTALFTTKASTTQLFLATGSGCLQAAASGLVSSTGSNCGTGGGGGTPNSKWATSTGSDITPNGGGGILVNASSTMGGGGTTTGLTIYGTATTTNRLVVITGSQAIGGPSANGPFTTNGVSFGNAIFACTGCGATGGNLLEVANYGGGSPGINTHSARGTIASPSATLSGDSLYFMGARGFGSTVWNAGSKAVIQMTAAENFSDTANGTYMTFETTPTGGTTRAERMRLDSAGRLGIGTTTPNWLLQLASSTASQLTLSDGSLTSNHWSLRNAGGFLYLATSSPSTFATSSVPALYFDQNGGLHASSTSYFNQIAVKNLEGVRYADQFPGSDIGAQVNAAYADGPSTGVKIYIPDGSYTFTTQMNFSTNGKPVLLVCGPGTVLNWNSSAVGTSTVFNTGSAASGAAYPSQAGMKGCYLKGIGGSSSVGVQLGGSNGAAGYILDGNHIIDFGVGIQSEKNTYAIKVTNSIIEYNNRNLWIESASNSGENMVFSNNIFADSDTITKCVYLQTNAVASAAFNSNSFDDCQFHMDDGNQNVSVHGGHFENPNQMVVGRYDYLVTTGGNFSSIAIFGSDFINDATTTGKSPNQYILNRAKLTLSGVTIDDNGAAVTVPAVVNNSGSDAKLEVYGIKKTGTVSAYTSLATSSLSFVVDEPGGTVTTNLQIVGNAVSTSIPSISLDDGLGSSNYAMAVGGGRAMFGYDGSAGALVLGGGAGKGIDMYVGGTHNTFLSGTKALSIDSTGITSLTNLLVTGSSTLHNFTALNSTTTNSTSTTAFSTTASSTNLFSTKFYTGNASSTGALFVGNGINIGSNNLYIGGTQFITSARTVRAANGSTGAASFSFANDVNTGMFTTGTNVDTVAFTNGGVQTAIIDAIGRIGVSTSTPQWLLQLATSTRSQLTLSTGVITDTHWSFRNSSGTFYLATSSPSGNYATSTKAALSIDVNGQPAFPYLVSCGGVQTSAAGVMSCTSDARLKEIHAPFTRGLDAIMQIHPQTFSWKKTASEYDGGVLYSGFIAQDVQKAIPEAVNQGNEGLQVSQLTVLATAVNAIKDLSDKVDGKKVIVAKAARSWEENWQWAAIIALLLWVGLLQWQVIKLKK